MKFCLHFYYIILSCIKTKINLFFLDFPEVTEKLQSQLEIIEQQVEYVPNLHVELSKRDKALLYSLLDALKSSANVLAVHHNATW